MNIDYVSICTPNYLHDAHIRFALRQEADAICEKPLVLNPWNMDALANIQKETGKKIFNILQLRVHPSIIALKEKVKNAKKDTEKKAYMPGNKLPSRIREQAAPYSVVTAMLMTKVAVNRVLNSASVQALDMASRIGRRM